MKKLTMILALVMLLSALAGCGSQTAPAETAAPEAPAVSNEPAVLDLQAIYDSLTSIEGTPEMLPLEPDMQFNFCGINPADCKFSIAAICSDGLRTDEIWLIEANDAEALARIQDAAQVRLHAKDEESISYSPEQNAVVKKAEMLTCGNYFALLVSPDVEAMAELFRTEAGI